MKTTESKRSSYIFRVSTPALNTPENYSFFSTGKQESNSLFGPHFIQPKLKIGRPNDKYEQQADRVADQVMRMSEPSVQRKCKECEEEKKLQKKRDNITSTLDTAYTSPGISSQITTQSGTGSTVLNNIRSEMGHKMETDFSGVNVHIDSKVAAMNRQLDARAFTHGWDIYFNAHQYAPQSRAGKRLLAHELSHTIRQKSLGQHIQMMQPCSPTLMESEDPLDGFQDYYGNSCVFHCCYRGILEHRVPEPDDLQNECFYDIYGRLVDENHENTDFGSTPNEYDSDRDSLKHTFWDEGGIVFSGWSAFWESRFRSEDRSDLGWALAHEECVRRLGGCPEYRPAGIPT